MRPIEKGPWPSKHAKHPKLRSFQDWRRAIPFLKERTGDYCHLCERRVTNAMSIEHVLPQKHFPEQAQDWDNFLLICASCNGQKIDTLPEQPIGDHYYWPHLHNTAFAFEYSVDTFWFPKPNKHAKVDEKSAQRLIDLYNLGQLRKRIMVDDLRAVYRVSAIKKAIDRRLEYLEGKATVEAIVSMATATGFFSLWIDIFKDLPEVRKALLAAPEFHLQALDPPCFNTDGEVVAQVERFAK